MAESSSPNARSRPFVSAPDTSRYYPAATAEEARGRLSRCIERGEGPGMLIGAVGTGKTMLLEVLAKQFADQMAVVPLEGSQICTRRALLQTILFQLQLPYRDMEEGELRLSLRSFLQPSDSRPRKLLLLVDEAEALPARLMEELRALTNQADHGASLVRLVLVGNTSLEENFADAQLETFSQRISARCYLAPFGREETFHYVRSQVAAVGHDPDQLFAPDGLEAMFAATDGVPRLVNQLGDQLVWMAIETGCLPLDAQIVQQAWSELQQLPAPWNMPTVEPTGNIVEFGELPSSIHEHTDEHIDEHTGEHTGEHTTNCDIENECDIEDIETDDLPASIPMSLARAPEIDLTESLGSAELLLEELGQQLAECASSATDAGPQIAVPPTTAHDPFQESFESEAIVADRYVGFEQQLLAAATRVTNYSDIGFAKQLGKCESAPVVAPSAEVEIATEAEVATSVKIDEPTGELLVVEDDGFPTAEVVSGGQFRRLFSSLEAGRAMSQIG